MSLIIPTIFMSCLATIIGVLTQKVRTTAADGGDSSECCEGCVEVWEAGHADVRKQAWGALSGVFGLEA